MLFPDPPTLAFWGKKQGKPQKMPGFSLRGTPKILGKERKNAQKSKGNRKTKKKTGLEGQGSVAEFPCDLALAMENRSDCDLRFWFAQA